MFQKYSIGQRVWFTLHEVEMNGFVEEIRTTAYGITYRLQAIAFRDDTICRLNDNDRNFRAEELRYRPKKK